MIDVYTSSFFTFCAASPFYMNSYSVDRNINYNQIVIDNSMSIYIIH